MSLGTGGALVAGEGVVGRTITKGKYKLISAGRHEVEFVQLSEVVHDKVATDSHKWCFEIFWVAFGRHFSPEGWSSTGIGFLKRSGDL